MDRETLSHYGWIVILVLILMCLLMFVTPFGSFVANGVKVTLDGYIATNDKVLGEDYMDSIVEEWENEFLDNETPSEGNDPDTIFTTKPDGTIEGVTPLGSTPELPADEIPSTIEFVFGKFESSTSYTPGEYTTVEYQEDVVQTKKPVGNVGVYSAQWHNGAQIKESLDTLEKTSTYIAYNFNTGKYSYSYGAKAEMVLRITIMEDEDNTLENAIYLAAYQNHVNNAGVHVAKWNGTKYEKVDCDAQINAITTFTEVVTVTKTKDVLVSEAAKNTTNVFIPLGTMKAEEGMTWNAWLASDYNTTNETNLTIRNTNTELVNLSSTIEAGKEYSFYDAETPKQAGLYVDGTVIKTWEELLNDGTLKVQDGLLKCTDKTISGDLIIASDESIIGIAAHGFEDCTKLTSVVIPGNIKTIYLYGFYDCSSLTNVELNEGLETLWEGVFRGCKSLIGLTFPDSLTYFENGGGAFMYCQSFGYINLGSGLTTVPNLYGKFEELIIPEGYTDGGYHTIATFNTVYVPTSVTQFGEQVSGFALSIFGGATIHYAGTEEQWNQIVNVNKISSNATIIFNSPYTGE